jgi:hypothetical protein
MPSTHTFRVGDLVLFGRENGTKTEGRVVGINPKSVKVEQTDARGGRPVGTVWRVAPSFIYPLEGSPAPVVIAPVALESVLARLLADSLAGSFRVGQRVTFSGKGRTVVGTVARINAKTVTVKDCNDGSRGWRVSPGMLTLATARA